jgi:uncharacterized sulfatase
VKLDKPGGRRRRPNVLWIYCEDMGLDLGCYGDPLVRTPHIDRLAAEGVLFTNAFVTAPVCSASRSAIITGRYQTGFGAHHHRSRRDTPLPPSVRLVTDRFRDAGYFTCNSAGPPAYDRPGKTDFNFLAEDPFDGTDWGERAPGQAFSAQCNLQDTHRMYRAAHGPPDAVPDERAVALPPYYPDHPIARRDWALYLGSVERVDAHVGHILRRLDEEGLAEDTIVFLFSDHGPGHVRHKQFLYDGGIRVPLVVRWPDGIEPGTVCEDLVSGIDLAPTALSLAGLGGPTAGEDAMEGMDGQAFLGPDKAEPRQYVVAARDRCDEADDRIRCVRTRRWKYIRNGFPERPWSQFSAYKEAFYPVLHLLRVLHSRGELTEAQARFLAPDRPAEELYDLDADPHEVHSLTDEPACAAVLEELRGTLDRWITETRDEGQIEEDPEIAAEADRRAAEQYALRMAEMGLPADATDEQFLERWATKFGGQFR